MAATAQVVALRARATELRWHLIPKIEPTGVYSARQIDRILGYRLLAHAEIEMTIEELFRDFAVRTSTAWISDRRTRRSVDAIVEHWLQTRSGQRLRLPAGNGRLRPPPGSILTATDVQLAVAAYGQLIAANHGIKRRNIEKMALCAGFGRGDLDAGWLADIDSLGNARSITAHSTRRVQTLPDALDEVVRVRSVIRGVAKLDRQLQRRA